MKTRNVKIYFAMLSVASVLSTLSFMSCKKKDKDEPTPTSGNYTVHGSTTNNTSSYVLQTESLTGGTVSAVGNGADVTALGTRPNNMMVKNGYYYNLNTGNNKFGKYKYENSTLVAVNEIPFTDFKGIGSSNWIDDNTLLISGGNASETQIRYAIINVQNMTITSSGYFPLPPSPVNNYILQAGTTFKRGNRMFIGYSYYENDNVYAILDTAYVTIVDYPSMTNPTHIKDARSAGAGGGSNLSWSIVESTGDIYLMTCPSDFYGVSSKPTGLLRIKSGEEVFDASYFFNLSTLMNNDDPLTLTSIANGKAITKNVKQSAINSYSDFTAGYIYEYYLIDLNASNVTKINVPLHKGLFNNILLDNGKAYFADNSENDGIYVYGYDPAAATTTKGLKIEGLSVINWIGKVQ